MTRRTASNLSDLETSAEQQQHDPIEAPGIMPPAGVPAKVKTQIEYTRTVDPDEHETRYPSELRQLAAEEDDNDDDLPDQEPPRDPLTEYCERWQRYSGYTLRVIRLPDPATRRTPGQTYRRPNFSQIEQLGDTYFEPLNLIGTLQILNQNSGGIFRIFLVDPTTNEFVPNSILTNLALADPPDFTPREQPRERERERVEIRAPEKSASELKLEQMKDNLFERVLMRALEPPAPTMINPDPLAGIDPATRATLFLIQEGNLLPSVVQKISALAGAPETAAAKESLGERALGMLASVAESNPQIIERVSSTLERIVNRLLPDPNAPKFTAPVEYAPMQRQPQAQRATGVINAPVQQPQQAVNTGLPEVPQPDDDWDDEEEMQIFDDLLAYLIGTEPIALNHPALMKLTKDYPIKAPLIAAAIRQMTLEQITEYVSSKSTMYDALLKNEYNVSRLRELKRQIDNAGKPQPEAAPVATEPEPVTAS